MQTNASFKKTVSTEIKLDYLLYLPKDYETSGKKYPLVIFLHGAGERGSDIEKVKVHGLPKQIAKGKEFDFIVVSPQCPENSWWSQFEGEKDTFFADFVKSFVDNYRVDTAKIYLTGLSMGGYGTWTLGAKYPKMFSALIPICGGFQGDDKMLENLKDIPMQVFHGARDTVVPIWQSANPVVKLQKMGKKNIKFTIYPDLEHDSWTKTYKSAKLLEWLLSQTNPDFSYEAKI